MVPNSVIKPIAGEAFFARYIGKIVGNLLVDVLSSVAAYMYSWFSIIIIIKYTFRQIRFLWFYYNGNLE